MKIEAPDPLLSAVLDDGDTFRRATLRQTLTLARDRRRQRFAGRALAAAVVLAGAAWLVRPPAPVPASKPIAAAPALRIVRTVPLAAGESIRTRSNLFYPVSTTPAGAASVGSQLESVVRISTRDSAPMIDYLDDRQLLAAFPGERPALIAPGTPDARLVFY